MNQMNQEERDAYRGALARFAYLRAWIDALEGLGDIDPVNEHTVIFQLSGGGGSETLTYKDVARASEVLDKYGRPSDVEPDYWHFPHGRVFGG